MNRTIQVLIADDSPSVRRLLASWFRGEEDIRVIASVANGERAVEAVERFHPDVVTLDVDMPEVDGMVALQRIMSRRPTPVVMISGAGARSATRTLQALESGAVDFVLKYDPGTVRGPETLRREIVAKVRAAAGIRTVRTIEQGASPLAVESSTDDRPRPEARQALVTAGVDPVLDEATADATAGDGVVVVGASTGGPVALRQLLAKLPANFPQPIVIVQHLPSSFVGALATQLARHTALAVRPADDGEVLKPGHVLLAPGEVHLLVVSDGRVHQQAGPPVHGHCPSIDVTMHSAARTFGPRACGVLLTGMGDDGSEGLHAIHLAGGRTYAQDEASSVVWGMPGRAVERGSAECQASPEQIAHHLVHQAYTSRAVASPTLEEVRP